MGKRNVIKSELKKGERDRAREKEREIWKKEKRRKEKEREIWKKEKRRKEKERERWKKENELWEKCNYE